VRSTAEVVGSYDLVSPAELVLKGAHRATIRLHGQPICGSPVEFAVRPGHPAAAKSRLQPPALPPSTGQPVEIVLQLVDKFSNDCERGDVRLDAKAFGPKASECQVFDRGDGTYSITFTAGVAGDYRLQARLENVEMSALHVKVEEGKHNMEAAPAGAPAASTPSAGAPASALSALVADAAQAWQAEAVAQAEAAEVAPAEGPEAVAVAQAAPGQAE